MIPRECKRLAEVDFPIAEGLEARGAGEVDSAWASEYAASVVGAAAVGFVAGGVAGVAAAGPVRRALPRGL